MGCLQQVLAKEIPIDTREPNTTLSDHQQGLNAYLAGAPETAEVFFKRSLAAHPDATESVYCLALLHNELGHFQDCITLLVDATIKHHDVRLNRLLGEAYQHTEQWEAAWQQFRIALTEEPHNAQLLMNMGIVCSRLNRMHEALMWLSRSAAVEPDSAQVQMNLGCILQSLNRIEDATHTLRAAVKLAPEYGTARWNLAQLLLLQGNFKEGLEFFEARFSKHDPVLLPEIEIPHWQGEPLAGKTIIISTEQAFGDAIQFVRYLPLLAQKGARVILYNHLKPLQQLFQSMPGISAVVTEKAQIPAADYFLPMLSLPRLFATGLDSIPSRMIPYLAPRPEKLHQWQQRVSSSSRMKIGLCWAGRNTPDPRRSARLDDFAPLSAFPETIFYSLQLGEGSEQAMTPPEGMALIDFTKDIDDFEDTAALLLQLDLVITIDTSVAHLAGALGRPVFTLLPFAPDWRWMLERTDCPWYPTMRLFRQKAPGDWTHPISRIVSCYSTLFPQLLC
jgi:tetratricopeptide (TPR) repeat protein